MLTELALLVAAQKAEIELLRFRIERLNLPAPVYVRGVNVAGDAILQKASHPEAYVVLAGVSNQVLPFFDVTRKQVTGRLHDINDKGQVLSSLNDRIIGVWQGSNLVKTLELKGHRLFGGGGYSSGQGFINNSGACVVLTTTAQGKGHSAPSTYLRLTGSSVTPLDYRSLGAQSMNVRSLSESGISVGSVKFGPVDGEVVLRLRHIFNSSKAAVWNSEGQGTVLESKKDWAHAEAVREVAKDTYVGFAKDRRGNRFAVEWVEGKARNIMGSDNAIGFELDDRRNGAYYGAGSVKGYTGPQILIKIGDKIHRLFDLCENAPKSKMNYILEILIDGSMITCTDNQFCRVFEIPKDIGDSQR